MKNLIQSITLLLFTTLSHQTLAFTFPDNVNTDIEKGHYVAEETSRRDQGWQDMSVKMEMVIKDPSGRATQRDMRLKTMEIDNDGDKSLSIFDTPRDIRGTTFLTHSHSTKPDDQWIFMPAIKRVKRIASKNKSGPFVGSTFSFEDLVSFEVEKFSYRYLGEAPSDQGELFIVEQTPEYEHSGYSKQISYIDQTHFRVQKIEFFDRKGDLLKTQTFYQYQQHHDKYWRAHKTEMLNHQTGLLTVMHLSNYQFGIGLTANDFNKNSIKRYR